MPDAQIIKECTRSFTVEGREFTASYLLGEERESNGCRCFIRAALRETCATGEQKESSTAVDLVGLRTDVGLQIFDAITKAEDPVFPVHIPDIVRDQVSATTVIEVKRP